MGAGGVAVGVLATLAALTSMDGDAVASHTPRPARERGAEEVVRTLKSSNAGSDRQASSGPSAERADAAMKKPPPDRVRAAKLLKEKRELEAELHTLETELQRVSGLPATGDPRDFDLSPEDWKELAAEGRVKYRVPCLLPAEGSYTVPPNELDALGLSPDDGRALNEAHRRSNARVWSTVRPLCLQAVGSPEVVELLGPSKCIDVIDKAAVKADFMATADARRMVAEVHAGLRPPPKEGEPQHPVFASLMAMTSESERFQADLAESFGPEEAKRIADGMRCVATVR